MESLFQNNSKEKWKERECGDQRGHQEGTNNQIGIVTGAVVSAKEEIPRSQVPELVMCVPCALRGVKLWKMLPAPTLPAASVPFHLACGSPQVTDAIVRFHCNQSDVVLLSVHCGQKGWGEETIVHGQVSPPLPSGKSQANRNST